jgi:hypothetical protein
MAQIPCGKPARLEDLTNIPRRMGGLLSEQADMSKANSAWRLVPRVTVAAR